MTKTVIYRYLGTNGILETPIHIEDTFYVRLIRLIAESGHQLTDGKQYVQVITVPEEEVDKWQEVPLGKNS